METNGYTLSDISAVANGMGGFGGNNSIVTLLLLFALIGGGGFGWNNRGDYNSAANQEILFNQHFNALDNKMDRGFTSIGNGLSDLGYALTNNIKDGNYATQNIVKDGFCQTQKNIDSVRFDMANYANAINSNIDNKFAALEKNQLQQTIQAQAQQIAQLQLAQQMCGVVRYPNQMVYAQEGSPFCNYDGGCCR